MTCFCMDGYLCNLFVDWQFQSKKLNMHDIEPGSSQTATFWLSQTVHVTSANLFSLASRMNVFFSLSSSLRTYHVEYTHLVWSGKLKERRLRLVLGWVTAWEYRVLLAVALFCRSATAIFLLRNSISTKKKQNRSNLRFSYFSRICLLAHLLPQNWVMLARSDFDVGLCGNRVCLL